MRAAWRSLGPHPIRVFNRETASGQEYAGKDPSPADQENVAVVGPAPIVQAQGVNPYQKTRCVGTLSRVAFCGLVRRLIVTQCYA